MVHTSSMGGGNCRVCPSHRHCQSLSPPSIPFMVTFSLRCGSVAHYQYTQEDKLSQSEFTSQRSNSAGPASQQMESPSEQGSAAVLAHNSSQPWRFFNYLRVKGSEISQHLCGKPGEEDELQLQLHARHKMRLENNS